ncbi:TonB-dependent receptor plug domain-containing protein [Nitrogeniibacter aestuarii]|uniref:TonB-dependent receptor plug domain-containing protein n=1 Tax=Nitrogeniibacter aestuarii TaxID=2815343 RepID=UPI001E574E4C|nr:TonB-dependent receptor [Nitrogeniibacter aestuarii]
MSQPKSFGIHCRALLILLPLLAGAHRAAAAELDPLDFSLGELVTQEVITVAKKRQEIGDVAAAVYVVSAEDIARTGVTTLPDALRLVPGVQVAALGNNRWAVSVRGSNGRFANKLLVMVDGRTVYSPLFSGTFWEALDIPMAEVDRIEVIRGPGASIWGANAVNGIVNIITKWSRATQGEELRLTTGNVDHALAYARHGGALDGGHYRVSYQGRVRGESSITPSGRDGSDEWVNHRIGFRMERFTDDWGELQVMGDVYRNESEDYWFVPDITAPGLLRPNPFTQRDTGASLSFSLNQIESDQTERSVQGSWQYFKQTGDVLDETRHTFDLEGQYLFRTGAHELIIGGGLRFNDQWIEANSGLFVINHPHRRYGLVSAFIHDDFTLLPDTLTLTTGLKFEHHTLTGNEWLPNVRLAWQIAPKHLLWGAVSEATRTPAAIETDTSHFPFVLNQMPPVISRVNGAESLRTERMRSYEIGYRGQPDPTVHFDATAYYMKYRNLRTLVPQQSVSVEPPWVVQDVDMSFSAGGRVAGVELALDWQPTAHWRHRLAYTRTQPSAVNTGNAVVDDSTAAYLARVPQEAFSLHTTWKPYSGHAVDMIIRHVDTLIHQQAGVETPPAYTELDLGYAWRYSRQTTVSVVGRNLLDARHAEFGRDYMPMAVREIERAVHVTVQWSLD